MNPSRHFSRAIALTLTILFTLNTVSCTGRLNRKDDYAASREALRGGNPAMALKLLPGNERKFFISVMEKTYLSLLSGGDDIDDLFRYSSLFDQQIRYDVSRELSSFFYANLPEGYFASEHEIIWTHLLLAWGFSKRGDKEKGEVEAKKAANLLSMKWSPEGRFDDPLLRILLGAIWTSLGNWDEAQVDFRKAYELDKTLTWAKDLGNSDKMPKNFYLVLGGTGREPGEKNGPSHLYTLGQLPFYSDSDKSTLFACDDKGKKTKLAMTPDSSKWYKRHQQRDNSIREVINKTNYGMRIAGRGTISTVKITGAIVVGIIIITGGITLGGVFIYAGASSGEADAITLGLTCMIGGPVYGANYMSSRTAKATAEFSQKTDLSQIYRYVRFLPEYAWLGWNEKSGIPGVFTTATEVTANVITSSDFINGDSRVSFLYFPDSSSKTRSSTLKNNAELNQSGSADSSVTEESVNQKLIRATIKEDISRIRLAITEKADINFRNENGFTALHYAIDGKNNEILNYLLKQNPDLSLTDVNGETYAHCAIYAGNAAAVKALAKNGADLNGKNYNDCTPLMLAVQMNNGDGLLALLECGADPNSAFKNRWSVLHESVRLNRRSITEVLLKYNADPNITTTGKHKNFSEGTSPLQVARAAGYTGIADLLVRKGAR